MTEEELKAQEAAAAAKAAEELKAKEAEESAKKAKENSFNELPEWAQEELRATRREAASYRTSANELKEKLAGSASAEEALKAAEAAVAGNARLKEQLELDAELNKLGLPADARALIDPNASIADRAKALAAVAAGNSTKVVVDGGLHSRRRVDTPEAANGAELMRDLIKNRRR